MDDRYFTLYKPWYFKWHTVFVDTGRERLSSIMRIKKKIGGNEKKESKKRWAPSRG
jgi:hypothetical protein